MRLIKFCLTFFLFTQIYSCNISQIRPEKRVLIFSKTAGYRHESITAGIAAIQKLGQENGFLVDTTENATNFKEENLAKYSAVIFLNTTGDVLDYHQQPAFERYIQAGGGFVGIHAASDTEYDWQWYGKLVGGYFNGHPNDPNVREAVLRVTAESHPATETLPKDWKRKDEWYNYKNLNPKTKVLLQLDESTYQGGTNGKNHPITWCHEFDGGRAFYIGLGHTPETYSEPHFLKLLLGGINYAIGQNQVLNYKKATTQLPPTEDRFVKTVLAQNLDEPMEFEMLPNWDILIIERKGDIKLFSHKSQTIETINHLTVHTVYEDGLLGLALDPDFEHTHWVYLFYSPIGNIPKQHVSRFNFKNGKIDFSSEKVILEIPVQRDECCHSAGSLKFGPDGNLFISVGDNTNPFASDGFAPIDEQKGRSAWDAQKSSANTNDLRGKILRIKPQFDGTYTIPEGNLFPKDGKQGRPEIYVMGCRNPFRFNIDPHTKFLYWGDVGPDAANDSLGRGYRGHDEVNQARKPGFFGWPYFVGNNKPYNDYDFANKKSLAPFNPAKPINNSPNNTGIQNLPPANPAFIWYPYANSDEFPIVKSGSRNAMAGPVYYYEDEPNNPNKFPQYYDSKLFIYDWMRRWILLVTMEKNGDLKSIEPFAPHLEFNNPVDMFFGKDGALYVLEYGTAWFKQNLDARLSRIDYKAGNRAPIAKIKTNKLAGKAPLEIKFSAKESFDLDKDDLTFAWKFTSDTQIESYEAEPTFKFTKPGIYKPYLIVKDKKGEIGTAEITVYVGNSPPVISWNIPNANRSFYWNQGNLNYEVKVSDEEDGNSGKGGINDAEVLVSLDYLVQGLDKTQIAQGHADFLGASKGEQLIEKNNCKSCHGIAENSTGPAYLNVAKRYQSDAQALNKLMNKVKNGGGGNWGDRLMPANPQIPEEDLKNMVQYILGLANQKGKTTTKPLKGTYTPDKMSEDGAYILSASYKDRGNGEFPGVTTTETIELRSPRLQAENFDGASPHLRTRDIPNGSGKLLSNLKHSNYLVFRRLDLSGVKQIQLQYWALGDYQGGASIEIRLGSVSGKLIGTLAVPILEKDKLQQIQTTITNIQGFFDVYLVFKNAGNINQNILDLDWIYFGNQGQATVK
jgi:cytochrome c